MDKLIKSFLLVSGFFFLFSAIAYISSKTPELWFTRVGLGLILLGLSANITIKSKE